MMHPRTALLAVAGLAATAAPSFAGWNNVFLTACNDCRPRVAQKPAATRADTQVEYERTSYSVPVTVMKPVRYTEEVPVQVKSYYYEPVTSYRTSYSVDPCTGECQQVQVPCRTSYVRREQCETVMKAVERVRMEPVQMERIVTEVRPKYTTTYYGPVQRTTSPLQPAGGPGVGLERDPAAPGTIPPAGVPPMRMPGSGVGGRPAPKQPAPEAPSNYRPMPPANALMTSLRKAPTGGMLTGDVVTSDRETPLANAKLVFVNAKDLDAREYVTADGFGGFDVKLPAGEWHLYVGNGNGKAVYHSKVSVTDGERTTVKVQDR